MTPADHIRTRLDVIRDRLASIDSTAHERAAERIEHWQRQGAIVGQGGIGLPTVEPRSS